MTRTNPHRRLRAAGGTRRWRLLLVTLAAASGLACATPFASDLDPRPRNEIERGEYEGPPPWIGGEAGESTEVVEFLARVFYVRLINRRFNSIATYHDPALRQLFETDEAFADYFAALADALTEGHFEALRPTAVSLRRLDVMRPDLVLVTVRLEGENSLPLRWWSVELDRIDRWERRDGRWRIIPGKL